MSSRSLKNPEDIAPFIDHTLLLPQATPEDIEKICTEAIQYKFKAVCVNPFYIPLCKKKLEGTNVLIATVVGFPLGMSLTETKVSETKQAVALGADEVDMVIPIGQLKSGNYKVVENDIAAVVKASGKSVVKVIIETCLLTNQEKVLAAKLTKSAGADFVKTSTGFAGGGATVEDVKLLRSTVGGMGVKASGGIKSFHDAVRMIKAGATRIGTSNGVNIMLGKD